MPTEGTLRTDNRRLAGQRWAAGRRADRKANHILKGFSWQGIPASHFEKPYLAHIFNSDSNMLLWWNGIKIL